MVEHSSSSAGRPAFEACAQSHRPAGSCTAVSHSWPACRAWSAPGGSTPTPQARAPGNSCSAWRPIAGAVPAASFNSTFGTALSAATELLISASPCKRLLVYKNRAPAPTIKNRARIAGGSARHQHPQPVKHERFRACESVNIHDIRWQKPLSLTDRAQNRGDLHRAACSLSTRRRARWASRPVERRPAGAATSCCTCSASRRPMSPTRRDVKAGKMGSRFEFVG